MDLLDAFARKISGEAKEEEVPSDHPDSLMMREAQRSIEKKSAKQLKPSEVAQTAGLSPNYFCSKFRDFTGLSSTDYLAGIRVAGAVRLLVSLTDESRKSLAIPASIRFHSSTVSSRRRWAYHPLLTGSVGDANSVSTQTHNGIGCARFCYQSLRMFQNYYPG